MPGESLRHLGETGDIDEDHRPFNGTMHLTRSQFIPLPYQAG
jgi:hypothetical protein